MQKSPQQKIKELQSQDYAEDAKAILNDWIDALNQIEVDKAFANLKNTREIIKAAQSRVASIDQKLLSERKLTTDDREYLLGAKDTLSTFIFWFDPKDYDNRRRSIEREIDANIEKGDTNQ